MRVVSSIDFTFGQMRMDARNQVKDQLICHIIQKVLRNEVPDNSNGVFFQNLMDLPMSFG